MDTITHVSKGIILVNGKLYKEQKTIAGRYTKEARATYMRQWRQSRKDTSENTVI